ncbi:MAG: DUF2975 domain-containing protein [Lachnospiraceae bacterium]
MWNKNKSLQLSIFSIRLFAVLLAAGVAGAPWIVRYYFGMPVGDLTRNLPFCIIIYCCAIPGFLMLLWMHRLLRNIQSEEVFTEVNVHLLRRLSWGCIAEAIIMFVAGFLYPSFFVISVAAAFIALIIRVIKNMMEQAGELKKENDFTI